MQLVRTTLIQKLFAVQSIPKALAKIVATMNPQKVKLVLAHMGKQRPVASTLDNACQKVVGIARGKVNFFSGWEAGNKYLCVSIT
jgi:predicted TIM-barrel fold metal-dependent hydrolase